jgi:3-methyladenine DNA glycosylase/8-oxoguanine DNA glycosylase
MSSTAAPAATEAEIVITGPFDLVDALRLHLRGFGDPTMHLGRTEAWRAMRTPDGPATLRLTELSPGRLRAQAWGPGADRAVEQAGPLVGVDDDPIAALVAVGPEIQGSRLLREVARRRPSLLRIGRTGLVIESLVPAILEQKVTGDEARRAWRYLIRVHGEPAPVPSAGPRLALPPSAGTLAELPYFAFHPAGVEQRRADVVRRVAARAGWLEECTSLPIAEAYTRMLALPGIGPWTAAEVALRALGDADAVSVGDYHLPRLVAWALAGESGGTDERMLELLAPFAPHRARVVRLIEASGAGPPRRGPRLAARRIEGH